MTGKKVPENRNSGISTNLYTTAKPLSLFRVIAHASTGAANARPVSSPAGNAKTTAGERAAPKAAITARKIPQFISSRMVTNSWCPWNTSPGRSGEATAAW